MYILQIVLPSSSVFSYKNHLRVAYSDTRIAALKM